MKPKFSVGALREGRWYEYIIRFGLGGLATVVAGLISSEWGPSVGGLFLALPAIFCASARFAESERLVWSAAGAVSRPRRSTRQAPRWEVWECWLSPSRSRFWW
jgi:hypothetical protein